MDRDALINELRNEFTKKDDLIPFVDQSKYIASTRTLDCNVMDIPMKDLQNLLMFIEQLRVNLEEAGKSDYPKMQSAMYAKMAARCVEYIIKEKQTL